MLRHFSKRYDRHYRIEQKMRKDKTCLVSTDKQKALIGMSALEVIDRRETNLEYIASSL
jgi:hypothetical protein